VAFADASNNAGGLPLSKTSRSLTGMPAAASAILARMA